MGGAILDPIMRVFSALLFTVTLVAGGWILSLPNKAECAASGRAVDPTERHCLSAAGFQQLEEHAAFHASQVALLAGVVLAAAYAVYRYRRAPARAA